MRPALRQARTLLNHDALQASIPTFLCPALLRPAVQTPRRHATPARRFSSFGRAQQEASAPIPSTEIIEAEALEAPSSSAQPEQRTLPRACPGCGAPSQLYDKKEAGFYNVDRGAVRAYLKWDPAKVQEATQEDDVYSKALKDADPELLKQLGVLDAPTVTEALSPDTPVCDRCHNLIHHSVGTPIHHPTVESIQATISESPHRRNHIYHVVDAADFPLSISSLHCVYPSYEPKIVEQNTRDG
jgi:hypothetical protein